jgi:hypothetical protein
MIVDRRPDFAFSEAVGCCAPIPAGARNQQARLLRAILPFLHSAKSRLKSLPGLQIGAPRW